MGRIRKEMLFGNSTLSATPIKALNGFNQLLMHFAHVWLVDCSNQITLTVRVPVTGNGIQRLTQGHGWLTVKAVHSVIETGLQLATGALNQANSSQI